MEVLLNQSVIVVLTKKLWRNQWLLCEHSRLQHSELHTFQSKQRSTNAPPTQQKNGSKIYPLWCCVDWS